MRIAFFGTPDFAVPSLVKLHKAGFDICCVITAKEKPKGRGLKIYPARSNQSSGIRSRGFEPENPNTREFYESLTPKNIDVGVLAAYGYILKPLLLVYQKRVLLICILPYYRVIVVLHQLTG